MLDGRFDPALAAIFAGEESEVAESPSMLSVIAVSLISVVVAGLLSWPLI